MNPDIFPAGVLDTPDLFMKPTAPQSAEIAGAFGPAVWKEKNTNGFITYPSRYQGPTSACVAYWIAKQLAVDEYSENGVYRELSPRSLYWAGFVPGGGMYTLQAADLATKRGVTLEYLLPSDGKTEQEMRTAADYGVDARQVALIYKPSSFLEVATKFDEIAAIIDGYRSIGKKKVVGITMVGVNNGTHGDLFPKPPTVPMITDGKLTPGLWAHKVTVTDFGTVNGKRYLAIDNTLIKGVGQQLLGEEWLPYIFGGIYSLDLPDDWLRAAGQSVDRPHHVWKTDLSVGSKGEEVRILQEALQSIGMFPIDAVVKPTGNYFGVTMNAVKTLQAAFDLQQTGTVDEPTRKRLNEIFGS